jgi:5-methylcytosine-specific restriction endonuclease McrA
LSWGFLFNMPKKGYKQTEETKRKISKANKGRKMSEEAKKKISESRMGEKNPMFGRKHSSESKKKMRESMKGGNKTSFTRERMLGNKFGFKKGNVAWNKGLLKENALTRNSYYGAFRGRRRRVLKRKAKGLHAISEWELLKNECGNKCLACKKTEPEIKLTEDHIIPLSRGGSDYIENIQPLCLKCNDIKGVKIIKY